VYHITDFLPSSARHLQERKMKSDDHIIQNEENYCPFQKKGGWVLGSSFRDVYLFIRKQEKETYGP
jgi:hypothetical protein